MQELKHDQKSKIIVPPIELRSSALFIAVVLTKITLIVLYGLCLLDMPYSFYQLVKFASLLFFIGLLVVDYRDKNYLSIPFSLIGIIIFNPIYKVALGAEHWELVDKYLIGMLSCWLLADFGLKYYHFRNLKKVSIPEANLTPELYESIATVIKAYEGTGVYKFSEIIKDWIDSYGEENVSSQDLANLKTGYIAYVASLNSNKRELYNTSKEVNLIVKKISLFKKI